MMKSNNNKWPGKVRFICISIDNQESALITHVNNKNWANLEHYHRTSHQGKTDPMNQYEIQGVPHILLVDKNGTVVYKGHPAGRKDLEKDINTLLDGGELEGKKDK